MTELIINGTIKEVEQIINRLIQKYGKESKLKDVLFKEFNKEKVILC